MALRVIIFYVLMWFFLLVLGGVQQETGIIPAEIGLPQWAPGLAGLLMLAIFKKDGLKLSWVSKDTPKIRYLLAVIVPLGVGLIVLLIKTLLNYPSGSGPNSDNLLLTILWAPLGALGEEIGWRGYLHKKLDTKMRGLISSILVGFLWMPMHVHYLSEGFPFILVFLFLIISYSIVVYSLVQDISFNVLAATLFHLTINYTNLLFLDVLNDIKFMLINAGIWVIAAVVMIILRKEIYFKPNSVMEKSDQ